jgi:4-hydroxy-3-polyprenylbenzoate decarboxylase
MTMVPEIIDMDMPVEGVFHNLVITKIKKDYAGQGQKVMNAMWGAGQMMFNKILVLADQNVSIQDYEALARYVFENLDPANDIYFSTGPMDVLDHSCSKLGFGGKMCIDGTKKHEEEINDNYISGPALQKINTVALHEGFPGIKAINDSLVAKNISCIIISVEKNRRGHIRELHQQIATGNYGYVKMILYVEHTVDPNDLAVALWRFCNNLDPKRDHIIAGEPAIIGFDGTRKTKEHDNFTRDWPNIIVADNLTISSVDQKWDSLGIGAFIPSPSLKFKDQLYGEEAAVH